MLDKFKDKKESVLREEIKDRVHQNLKESHDRIRELETNYDSLKARMVQSDEVEEIVKKRFD